MATGQDAHSISNNPLFISANDFHGGMDYIMLNDFFDAVKNKKMVPLDAYDVAAGSAVSALSEMSVARGGSLVDFPDFTRGQWIRRQPVFGLDT